MPEKKKSNTITNPITSEYFLKTKIAKLRGTALDWEVAKAEKRDNKFSPENYFPVILIGDQCFTRNYDGERIPYTPSEDWAQGGPIIERERICLGIDSDDGGWEWEAQPVDCGRDGVRFGPTPLIAAMRCFVASKLGKEIK